MPNRVIRGDINSSRSLSHVSRDADLTFRALLVAVDDFGRMDARPEILKAILFPTRQSVTAEQVLTWVRELDAEGCVRLYILGGYPYLCLPTWELHRGKQRRAAKSLIPDPPSIAPSPACPEIRGSACDPPEIRSGGGVGGGGGVGVSHGDRSPGMEKHSVSPEGEEPEPGASEEPKPKPEPPTLDPEALRLSDVLVSFVKAVPGGRIPTGSLRRWAFEIQAMPREIPELLVGDEIQWPHIEAGIRFAFSAENLGAEYEVVIRSGRSLREKWPKLVAAARRKQASAPVTADEILGVTR